MGLLDKTVKTTRFLKAPTVNRFFRNSFFYTYGSFFETHRLFFRKSRSPSWSISYSSTLNFIKFLGTQKFTRLKPKYRRKVSHLATKRFYLLKSLIKSKKKRCILEKVKLVNLPLVNSGKALLLIPTRLIDLLTPGVAKQNILLKGTLDLSVNDRSAIITNFMSTRYGIECVKKDLVASNQGNIMLNSSLKRQGVLKRRNFPDINKSTRPTGPDNNIFSYYRSFILILRLFPVLVITFRANNLFFVLSSPEGKVVFSYSVGLGGDFKKASRRSVFAYDTASREFAKRVKTVTSVVGLRIQGQSKRRFYVLRNLKKAGLRFIFLQDVIPFACNGVKKARRARKRRRR